jgi:hypothetical protein
MGKPGKAGQQGNPTNFRPERNPPGAKDRFAAVKFIAVLFSFLLLLFAIIQSGLVFFTQHQMMTEAREVSRRVSVGELTVAQARSKITDRFAHLEPDVRIDITVLNGGRDIAVSINVPAGSVAIFDPGGFLNSIDISAFATSQKEK